MSSIVGSYIEDIMSSVVCMVDATLNCFSLCSFVKAWLVNG